MGAALRVLASSQDDLITEPLRGKFISIYASEMLNVVISSDFRSADLSFAQAPLWPEVDYRAINSTPRAETISTMVF